MQQSTKDHKTCEKHARSDHTDEKHATVDKIDLSACKWPLKTMQLSTKDHNTNEMHAAVDKIDWQLCNSGQNQPYDFENHATVNKTNLLGCKWPLKPCSAAIANGPWIHAAPLYWLREINFVQYVGPEQAWMPSVWLRKLMRWVAIGPCVFWVLCDWSRPCWCIVEGGLKYFNDLNYNARHCFSKLLLQGHFRSSLSWVPSGHPFIILRSLE